MGTIRTVLGDVVTEDIGPTTMHEHLLIDLRRWFQPSAIQDGTLRSARVSLGNAPDIRWSPLGVEDNLVLSDPSLAIAELKQFQDEGGSCVVDMTSMGLGGSPSSLTTISRESGVHVVLGAGFFVHEFHPGWACEASVEAIEEWLLQEVHAGIAETTVRPGVLGEIGLSGPTHPCEERILRAAARVGAAAGLSVHIHVDPQGADAPRFVELCEKEGLSPQRVVCGHMDVRLDLPYHVEVLRTGATIGLDTFGTDVYFSGMLHRPDDLGRLSHLRKLLDLGFGTQIVMAQDVAFKCHLAAFGGNGYHHLLRRVVPQAITSFGVSESDVTQLLIANPRGLLQIDRDSS